jgi:predicted dehydrogenase
MTLRLGLIGRGRWGRNIERTLQSFGDVAVIPIGRNERQPSGLDGVLIATPSDTHAELAIPYIVDGIPTFIEKPMATSARDAERVREATYRSGAIVVVGHIHLHNPAFRALLAALPSIGPLRSLDFETMNLLPRTDASILWDWLPHHLSVARAILGGPPSSVSVRPLNGAPVSQAASITFMFGDVPLKSTVSWLSPVRRQLLDVQGRSGKLLFDDRAERKLVRLGADGEIRHPNYDPALPLTVELADFCKRIRSRTAYHREVDQSVDIIRAIEAAERAVAAGGGPIAIHLDGCA